MLSGFELYPRWVPLIKKVVLLLFLSKVYTGRHCLHFSSLAYNLTHRSRTHIYKLNSKVERVD